MSETGIVARTAASDRHLRTGFAGVGIVVLVAAVADIWISAEDLAPSRSVEGVALFAVPLLMAQTIERLVEPFAEGLSRWKDKAVESLGVRAERVALVEKRFQSSIKLENAEAIEDDTELLLKAATERNKAADDLATIERNRSIWLWSLASALATVGCAVIGFSILRLIGAEPVIGGEFVELLTTGLVVGSGTKPVHELVKRLSAPATSGTPAT